MELDRSVGTEVNFQATQMKFKPIATYFQNASRNLQAAVQELRDHQKRMLAKQQKPQS